MTKPLRTQSVERDVARVERVPISDSGDPQARAANAVDFGPAAGLAGFMLRLAQVQVYEAFFSDFQRQQIRPGQIGLLISIGCNPGIGQGALAEALRIKRSNMAKVMRVLERDGMIERRVPARDQRAVELRLTRRGRAFVERFVPEIQASDRAATAMLSERERATLLKLLAKIAGYEMAEAQNA